MFKIDPNPTFWASVGLSVPGQARPVTVEIKFAHKTREQIRAFFDSLENRTDEDALAELVQDWKGFDADFSQENLGRLLESYPTAARELFAAYSKEVMEGRAKN